MTETTGDAARTESERKNAAQRVRICGLYARGQCAVCERSGSEVHCEARRRGWRSSLKIMTKV